MLGHYAVTVGVARLLPRCEWGGGVRDTLRYTEDTEKESV
jgi:hypothetical protein